MSAPDYLCPATLRWVADDLCRYADAADRNAEQVRHEPSNMWLSEQARDAYVHTQEEFARSLRNEAKRLRNLATRAERRRGGR